MSRVYVLNRGAHDFDKAKKFGELVYLTDGVLGKLSTGLMFRTMQDTIGKDSKPDDFIVISSLTTLCSIACSIFAVKHGKLNLLLYHNNEYVYRHLQFRKEE